MFTRRRLGRSLSIAGVMLTLGGTTLGVLGTTTYAVSVGPGTTVSVENPNYSTDGKACDPNRDGYHFIMNGLEYPAGSVIDGADFGPILITFSDASTGTALFTDLTGAMTAHFLDSITNQSGNFTIVSAQMTFPAGTDITGFNQFRISHPPCGTTTTTTTTEAATTTTEAATTTTEEATTTTEAATTTTEEATTTTEAATTTTEYGATTTTEYGATTTTEYGGTTLPEETTTTAATATTATPTTQVASQFPVPTTTTTIAPVVASEAPTVPPTALPVTGSKYAGLAALLGLSLLTAGIVVSGLSRRPRPLES